MREIKILERFRKYFWVGYFTLILPLIGIIGWFGYILTGIIYFRFIWVISLICFIIGFVYYKLLKVKR